MFQESLFLIYVFLAALDLLRDDKLQHLVELACILLIHLHFEREYCKDQLSM